MNEMNKDDAAALMSNKKILNANDLYQMLRDMITLAANWDKVACNHSSHVRTLKSEIRMLEIERDELLSKIDSLEGELNAKD